MKGIRAIVRFFHERRRKLFRLRASKVFAEVYVKLEKFGYPVNFEVTRVVVENLYSMCGNLSSSYNFLNFFEEFGAEDFPQRGQCLFVKSMIEMLAFGISGEPLKDGA
jgi:hypothetical protein